MQLGTHASCYFKAMFNNHLNKILSTLAIIYIFSMGIWPLLVSKGCWDYILDVWHRWQGFNVGVLALLTSLMAFKITKYREEEQRKRNFIAARAFLPDALSRLCSYFKSSAHILKEAFGTEVYGKKLESNLPHLPDKFEGVFKECIRYSDPAMGKHLSRILVKLQIFQARVEAIHSNFCDKNRHGLDVYKHEIQAATHKLAELQALVNTSFQFARGEKIYTQNELTWKDYHTAYQILSIFFMDEFSQEIISGRK